MNVMHSTFLDYPIKCQCCPHVETSQTDFDMRATQALNGLSKLAESLSANRCSAFQV